MAKLARDYFYDFEERIDAKYLYYNKYITRGANTITNASGLNPYLDTLNFRTLPNYTVSGNSELVNHALGISSANVSEYNMLYPLDEQNTASNDWCNKMLVKYHGKETHYLKRRLKEVDYYLDLEKYITRLWEKRGVKWDD